MSRSPTPWATRRSVHPGDRSRRGASQRTPRGRRARRTGAPRKHRARRPPPTRRLRHRAGRADRRAGRDRDDRQRRSSATAATAQRPRRDRAAATRPAVRDRAQTRYRVQPLPLEPGDRLIFFTDGMLERNAASLEIPPLVQRGPRSIPGKPSSTSFRPSFRQPMASSKTTRPSCASTGTAAVLGNARATRAPTTETRTSKRVCWPGRTP